METYVALLRGINVGGKRRVKMTELKELLGSLDCGNVLTYLQSGNAIFRSSAEIEDLSRRLPEAFADRFGFGVPILLLYGETLLDIYRNNPLVSRPEIARDHLHVTLLHREPAGEVVQELIERCGSQDEAVWKGRAIYLYCPEGYRNCSIQNAAIEKRLGCQATTRNWRTISALADLVQ